MDQRRSRLLYERPRVGRIATAILLPGYGLLMILLLKASELYSFGILRRPMSRLTASASVPMPRSIFTLAWRFTFWQNPIFWGPMAHASWPSIAASHT